MLKNVPLKKRIIFKYCISHFLENNAPISQSLTNKQKCNMLEVHVVIRIRIPSSSTSVGALYFWCLGCECYCLWNQNNTSHVQKAGIKRFVGSPRLTEVTNKIFLKKIVSGENAHNTPKTIENTQWSKIAQCLLGWLVDGMECSEWRHGWQAGRLPQ